MRITSARLPLQLRGLVSVPVAPGSIQADMHQRSPVRRLQREVLSIRKRAPQPWATSSETRLTAITGLCSVAAERFTRGVAEHDAGGVSHYASRALSALSTGP
jgi:hypothetical protein